MMLILQSLEVLEKGEADNQQRFTEMHVQKLELEQKVGAMRQVERHLEEAKQQIDELQTQRCQMAREQTQQFATKAHDKDKLGSGVAQFNAELLLQRNQLEE